MDREVRLTKTDCVPNTATVCHYDELDEPAKESFPQLADRTNTTIDPELAATLTTYDYVKYTEYYRINSTDVPRSNRGTN